MSKEHPSYYSIITASVRYDNRLTDSEKLLFAEITALSNRYGYCTASNNYFAKLYEVARETISRRISKLSGLGYLTVKIVKEGNQVKQRKLYPIDTNVNTPIDNSVNTPIDANVKENITSINNTSKNISILSSNDSTPSQVKEIIDYLNKQADKKYKYGTRKTKQLINARMNEGNTVDDFKRVIETKASEWKNSNMEQYLRPETLFGTKFESYLNQGKGNNDKSLNNDYDPISDIRNM